MAKHTVRRWLVWFGFGVVGLVALLALALLLFVRASLPRLDGAQKATGLTAPVTVARDVRGVPLISGANRLDVAYASGVVHAQDRFFQMDLMRRTAAGELAELFGERALALDKAHRLHRFRARADRALQAMAPAERALLQRYADGVNDGLGALGARPFEYGLLMRAPRAWTAADSLLVVWAMYLDLQGNLESRELARGWLREHSSAQQLAFLLPASTQWDAPLDAVAIDAANDAAIDTEIDTPAAPIPATPPAWWDSAPAAMGMKTLAAAQQAERRELFDAIGSNNWAVGGSRTADGAAIVADDMHLALRLPNTWYRAAAVFPGADGAPRRLVGVMLPGTPIFAAGSNGHVAWGLTNSYGDYLDLVETELDRTNPQRARVAGGAWEELTLHRETIAVKGGAAVTLTVRDSSLGPLREAGGKTYALHWIAHAPDAVRLDAAALERADTLDAALAAAANMGVPAQNFIAGDAQGNIGWTIVGPLPRRAQPAAAASFPLDAQSAANGWQGRLDPRAYPQVRNPPDAQLATANSRQLAGPGAALIGDGGFDLGARTQQVRAGLTALGARTDVAGVYAIGLDDRALFLAPWHARAIAVLAAQDLSQQPARAEMLRLLRTSWSGRASVESVGYRLTRAYLHALYEELFGGADAMMAQLDSNAGMARAGSRWPAVLARLLDAHPDGWLPKRYASWDALQLAALDRAGAELTRGGSPLAAASWGARNTAAIAHPLAGVMPALLRRWLSAPPDMLPGDSHMPRVAGRNFGQSERLVVAPGHEEQGLFNMPGGQSGHPCSPFFLAGHEDWVSGKPGPLLPGPARHTLTLAQ